MDIVRLGDSFGGYGGFRAWGSCFIIGSRCVGLGWVRSGWVGMVRRSSRKGNICVIRSLKFEDLSHPKQKLSG